ncbi:secreted and transmembrane protein 1b-like isoform X4 [Arvicanthis niloticus]|uniref:secreted and transmembrane protein 1b-like isoform X4 n=1 Tax=Arvicanthis niloticus TaxID=61156 RepID=UPI00402BA29E
MLAYAVTSSSGLFLRTLWALLLLAASLDAYNTRNYSKESWQLQIQGGQAQLVITNAQDIHAGEYSWMLRGRQRNYTDFILNVIGLATKKQEPTSLQVHDESPTTVRTEVIFVIITIIIIITGISAFAWYKHRHSLELHKYKFQATGPSHGSPGSPYLTLP